MRKLLSYMGVGLLFGLLIASTTLVTLTEVKAQATTTGALGSSSMDPRARVMITMSTYGTVGGALLGTASMAWGMPFRSIFIGASLGLYAGILFGGYLIGTHYYYRQNTMAVKKGESPYSDDEDLGEMEEVIQWKWIPEARSLFESQTLHRAQAQVPLMYFDVFNWRF